ncbi:MAG: hypothetical protein QG565_1093 [Campylobacterota bacterium]|nr:hypothetical protein [Campylobacterota bacterium]MDQ1267450.1 hypothetical protein [Campylobacterota bacterium]MDQ1338182.1 hypothetical protein [Campylobacterota bacterium]
MQTLQLDEKVIVGLLMGVKEDRLDLLSNETVLKSFDIDFFKFLTTKRVDKKELSFWKEEEFDRYEIVEILQVLAYNRHKTRDSEKTANMIFDKLFEIISDGEV